MTEASSRSVAERYPCSVAVFMRDPLVPMLLLSVGARHFVPPPVSVSSLRGDPGSPCGRRPSSSCRRTSAGGRGTPSAGLQAGRRRLIASLALESAAHGSGRALDCGRTVLRELRLLSLRGLSRRPAGALEQVTRLLEVALRLLWRIARRAIDQARRSVDLLADAVRHALVAALRPVESRLARAAWCQPGQPGSRE